MKIFLIFIKNIILLLWKESNDLYDGKKTQFKFPTERYLNIVIRGYKDCDLDISTQKRLKK